MGIVTLFAEKWYCLKIQGQYFLEPLQDYHPNFIYLFCQFHQTHSLRPNYSVKDVQIQAKGS